MPANYLLDGLVCSSCPRGDCEFLKQSGKKKLKTFSEILLTILSLYIAIIETSSI